MTVRLDLAMRGRDGAASVLCVEIPSTIAPADRPLPEALRFEDRMTRMKAAALLAATTLTLSSTWPATASNPRAHAKHAEHAPAMEYPAGAPGNPREPAVQITITMQETYDGKMLFAPDKVNVPVGQQVRFVLTNYGQVDHSFVIGTDGQSKDRELSAKPCEPNARIVPAATQADILWRFSKPGRYEFASVLPGQYAAGMKGTINVGGSSGDE